MERVFFLSRKYKFKIIEDASHALGAKYKNNIIGDCEYSDMCVFSFHPVKSITTAEGGMITTNKKNLALKLMSLRTHGIVRDKNKFIFKKNKNQLWYYEQNYLGYNYRMNDIESALGISQLQRLDKLIKLRKIIFDIYNKILRELPIILPKNNKFSKSANHLYVIRIDKKKTKKNRNDLFNFLRKNNLFVNIHYIPIYRHPYYAKMSFNKSKFANCEKYYDQCLSIPIYPGLKKYEIFIIKNLLKKFFNVL
jgi:dTDP-4-amino-4,6-dideoxygalactose transaminase